jgi:hypothetical protein
VSRTRILYVEPPRRLPRVWVMAAALGGGTLAGAYVATVEAPDETVRQVRPTALSGATVRPIGTTLPGMAAAPTRPAPPDLPPVSAPATVAPTALPPHATPALAVPAVPAAPAWSTEVAPGVHVTAIGAPPGTTPVPAGPQPDDSEPEN